MVNWYISNENQKLHTFIPCQHFVLKYVIIYCSRVVGLSTENIIANDLRHNPD